MKVLIYSQEGSMGGSTRLLLNLAHYLAKDHQVSVALKKSNTPEATRILVSQFPGLNLIRGTPDFVNEQNFDVALLHMPYSLDHAIQFNVTRKIAIIMELAKTHTIRVDDKHSDLFEKILFLHPEQAAHFSSDVREKIGIQMPLINNIDFQPEFSKTRSVGCVGGAHKTDLALAIRLLEALPTQYLLRWWSARKLTLEGLSGDLIPMASEFLNQQRLQRMPAMGDIRLIASLYDVLLHTPLVGNGTSVVISDALNCGKLVVLSPLPDYKMAYGDLPGVLFIDDTRQRLVDSICMYSKRDFLQISQAYQAQYDRSDALQQWQRVIEG